MCYEYEEDIKELKKEVKEMKEEDSWRDRCLKYEARCDHYKTMLLEWIEQKRAKDVSVEDEKPDGKQRVGSNKDPKAIEK